MWLAGSLGAVLGAAVVLLHPTLLGHWLSFIASVALLFSSKSFRVRRVRLRLLALDAGKPPVQKERTKGRNGLTRTRAGR